MDLCVGEEDKAVLRVPMAIAIWRPAPTSIVWVRALMEDLGTSTLITVGDVVTVNTLGAGLDPSVSVVDGRTLRHVGMGVPRDAFDVEIRVRNPPGRITEDAMKAVRTALGEAEAGRSALLVVDGEEDLLALPLIAWGPENGLVLYGHFMGALVAVPIRPYRRYLAVAMGRLAKC